MFSIFDSQTWRFGHGKHDVGVVTFNTLDMDVAVSYSSDPETVIHEKGPARVKHWTRWLTKYERPRLS